MRVDDFYLSIDQPIYRIIPDDPDNDPLDPSFAALTSLNRWNFRGEPTLYAGSDPRVMATEWARHVAGEIQDSGLAREQHLRRIYEVHAHIDQVLDLRSADVCGLLSLENVPLCFATDRDVCQQAAHRLRTQTEARALIVPAIGLIDQPERWVLVIFVDKLPSYPEPFLTDIRADGTLPKVFEWLPRQS